MHPAVLLTLSSHMLKGTYSKRLTVSGKTTWILKGITVSLG